jgi:hypothetical protein
MATNAAALDGFREAQIVELRPRQAAVSAVADAGTSYRTPA